MKQNLFLNFVDFLCTLKYDNSYENSLAWELTIWFYLICLKVSVKVTCLHFYSLFILFSGQHIHHSLAWEGRGKNFSMDQRNFKQMSLASYKIRILVCSWHVVLKASVLYCLFYFIYFNKVHFNMINVDISVQKVRIVSSLGFWQYFSSHNNPETFLILSVSRDI